MNMFYGQAPVYKPYQDKIDLSSLSKELLISFNKEFYTNFIKIVISDLSLDYKKQFIHDWFAATLIEDKKYGDNLEWIMSLFKESSLLDMSNDGQLFSILIDKESNVFDSYNDYLAIMNHFPKMDNFKDYAFILAKDERIEKSILESINNLSEFNFFKYNLKKVQKDFLVYTNCMDDEKKGRLSHRENFLKTLIEKEKIENYIDESISLPEDNIKKRL